MSEPIRPELVCPAGTPGGLRTAVEAGADAVYCGFQDATNARNFPGLNFSRMEIEQSIAWAHERGAKVLVALNTFPPAGQMQLWKTAVDDAARLGADAIAVMAQAAARHGVQVEVQVFGRIPLALSARCYSAQGPRAQQGRLSIRLRPRCRRDDLEHAGRQAVSGRQWHPDHVAHLPQPAA